MIENFAFVVDKVNMRGGEYAVVKNPSYIFPPEEYYPLAPSIKYIGALKAVLMDMDGTTTTTEVLCIHALEQMVRQMSGMLDGNDWAGLDPDTDYQNIIGNSTTRHVEYLIQKYGRLLSDSHIQEAFLAAAWWTLKYGVDKNRQSEVIQNLRNAGLYENIDFIQSAEESTAVVSLFKEKIAVSDFATRVSLGIDIYYQGYHKTLARINNGEASMVKHEIFGDGNTHGQIISPMPGIPVVLPLLKGWLGEEAGLFAEALAKEYNLVSGVDKHVTNLYTVEQQLVELGKKFEQNPIKLGLVTSSIRYEADIVMLQVLGVVSEFIKNSTLSEKRKVLILEKLKDPMAVYDVFVTASDSSEIRLKPHRDLYSIALQRIGLLPIDFDKVIGFEDSQSGTVAIRAAGIGCCIAVPFAQTSTHNLEAASHLLPGGLPQAIIEFGFFLSS